MIQTISFDAGSTAQTNSVSHTGASDATLAIVFGFLDNSSAGIVWSGTYGSSNLVAIRRILNLTEGRQAWAAYVKNPPSGSQTVTVTTSSGTPNLIGVITLKNASSIGIDEVATSASAESSKSISITTTARKSWIVYMTANQYRNDATHSSSTGDERWEYATGAPIGAGYTTAANEQPGSNTVTITCSDTEFFNMIAIEIKPKITRGLIFI